MAICPIYGGYVTFVGLVYLILSQTSVCVIVFIGPSAHRFLVNFKKFVSSAF